MNKQRRDFLKYGAAGWILAESSTHEAIASSLFARPRNNKIVWVMLRGAMDALHGVLPVGDENFETIRGAMVESIKRPLLALNRDFALHPALKSCYQWYQNEQLCPIVAVASGYRKRSHFDGQDQMESGLNITDYDSGWLARAVRSLNGHGLAIAQTVPIALRGQQQSQTWYPPHFAAVEDDLLESLESLYAENSEFSALLADAINNKETLAMEQQSRAKPNFSYLAKNCGELLSRSDSAQCAMLELNGWDTHNNQAQRLNRQFTILDQGLAELKNSLADTWKDTVVIVSTEFGRTVKINGTKGTDHGTGSAMFILGGAVKGKQVLGKWPGLAEADLYEKRDLMPTTDVRSWMASVLHQHWDLSLDSIGEIFPEVKPIPQVIIN